MDTFFYKHPVFRLDEIIQWKRSNGIIISTAKNLLAYYLKQGRIVSIKRGLYAVVSPDESIDDLMVDPYLVAGKASDQGALGYHTALELHGVAYSSFEHFYFVTSEKIRRFQFQGRSYQAVTPPSSLADDDIEVIIVNRQGVDVRVTSIERTFVDMLDRIELSGGWGEVLRSVGRIGVLDIDRIVTYCLLMNKSILSAKVGYVLEQRLGVFAPTDDQLKLLQNNKPRRPIYVSVAKGKPSKLCRKWNIMLPPGVYRKVWEEPDYDV